MSLFDQRVDIAALEENVRQIAATILAFLYNKPVEVTNELLQDQLAISREHIQAVIDYVTSQPRATQVLLEKGNTLVPTLEKWMARFLPKQSHVRTSTFEPDRREPEFVLYDQTTATLQISEVSGCLLSNRGANNARSVTDFLRELLA